MKVINLIFAVIALFAGFYFALSSLTAQIVTGEHAATLACACFLFVIALGVWKNNAKHEKRMENLLEESLRRQGPANRPPQPQQPFGKPQEY